MACVCKTAVIFFQIHPNILIIPQEKGDKPDFDGHKRKKYWAILHNSKCRYGERGAADAKPKAQIILDAAKVSAASGGNSEPKQGAAVAECEGLLPPKHDAGTATRHYRAFWQRRCRTAAAGAVLKPQGGNCAVLPKESTVQKSRSSGVQGAKQKIRTLFGKRPDFQQVQRLSWITLPFCTTARMFRSSSARTTLP